MYRLVAVIWLLLAVGSVGYRGDRISGTPGRRGGKEACRRFALGLSARAPWGSRSFDSGGAPNCFQWPRISKDGDIQDHLRCRRLVNSILLNSNLLNSIQFSLPCVVRPKPDGWQSVRLGTRTSNRRCPTWDYSVEETAPPGNCPICLYYLRRRIRARPPRPSRLRVIGSGVSTTAPAPKLDSRAR